MSYSSSHPALPITPKDEWVTLEELISILSDPDSCVIADTKVLNLHRIKIKNCFQLIASERSKSFTSLEKICTYINERRIQGCNTVYSLGGGTIGDVAGLAAHLVKRGMNLIHIPSTLLAAVDSSIGGKTAINDRRRHKNVFGAYHFSEKCLLCPELWTTLPVKNIRDGYAEVCKMVICLDKKIFSSWLDKMPDIETVVKIARRLKKNICNEDPFEITGKRYVLNFGHTLGHALESLSRFRISHGYAVVLGIRAALDLGTHIGITTESVSASANSFLDHFKLPDKKKLVKKVQAYSADDILKTITFDKKRHLRFVLLKEIGSAELVQVKQYELQAVIKSWLQ